MPSDLLALVQPGPTPPEPQTKDVSDEDFDQAMAKHRGHPEDVVSLLNQADGKSRSRIQASVARVLPKEDQDQIKKMYKGGGGKEPAHKDVKKGGGKEQHAKDGKGDAKADAKGKEGKEGKGAKAAKEGGGGAGGGEGAGGDPIAEADSVAAQFGAADRQLIEDEVAEHQQWAAIGYAGSTARLELALAAAGKGLGGGFVTGAAAGLVGGVVGKALEKVPILGAIVAGGLSAWSLVSGWENTSRQLRGLAHNPFASWESAANFMDGLGALLGLVANVLNILAGLAAFAAGLGLVLTIIGIGGFVLPWAVPFASYAMLAANVLSATNSAFVQPMAAAFRFMHVYTMGGDPETVMKEAELLEKNTEAIGAFAGAKVGGLAGKWVGDKIHAEGAGTWMANKFPPLAGRATPLPVGAGSGARTTGAGSGARATGAGSGAKAPAAAGSGQRATPAPSAAPSRPAPASAPQPEESPAPPSPEAEGQQAPAPQQQAPEEGTAAAPDAAPTEPMVDNTPTQPMQDTTPTEVDYKSRPGRVIRGTNNDPELDDVRSFKRVGINNEREREGATEFYEEDIEEKHNLRIGGRKLPKFLGNGKSLADHSEHAGDLLAHKSIDVAKEHIFPEHEEEKKGGEERKEPEGREPEAKAEKKAKSEAPPLVPAPFTIESVQELAGQAHEIGVERKKLMLEVKEARKIQSESAQRQPHLAKLKAAADSFKQASVGHGTELAGKQSKLDAAKAKHEEYKGQLASHQNSLSDGPVGTILGVTRTMESMLGHLNRILDVSSAQQNVSTFRKNLEKGSQALSGEGAEAAARAKEHDKMGQDIAKTKATATGNVAKLTQHGAKIEKLTADDKAGEALAKQAESQGKSKEQQLAEKQKELEAQFTEKRTKLTEWANQHKAARDAIRKGMRGPG